MKQTREQYQQQLRDKIKEQKACTEQDRQQLRDQLRTAIKDQVRDREQLRERLQTLRESVPSHDELWRRRGSRFKRVTVGVSSLVLL